jgi:hypothetical protein
MSGAVADARRACRDCGVTAIAGAEHCLRCGGELGPRRRPVSPFGMAADRRRVRRRVAAVLSVLAVVTVSRPEVPGTDASPGTSRQAPPTPPVTLAVTEVPQGPEFRQVKPQDVQESCVGRPLPGDLESAHAPPAVIDGNPMTSWHCDGDGAQLRPPQSLSVFFTRPMTLSAIGVVGYDPFRPCRFVTSLELVIGAARYRIPLPVSLHYPALRWFAVPPVRADRLTLVVLKTAVPHGWHGPNCSRTAIAEVDFAVRQ